MDYVNLTSTAIEVTWMPPDDPNGIVESYILMLTFEANGTSNNITDISATTFNVTGLQPYQVYTVVVYALTDRGAGSGSVPLNVLTDEDSKLPLILTVYMYSTILFSVLYMILINVTILWGIAVLHSPGLK